MSGQKGSCDSQSISSAQFHMEQLEGRLLLDAVIELDAVNGLSHTFTDGDGDQVTVALRNATGTLTLSDDGDIISLLAVSGGPSASININVRRSGGGTGETVMPLIELDGVFRSISGRSVILRGDGIRSVGAIDSSVVIIQLKHILDGADIDLPGVGCPGTLIRTGFIGDDPTTMESGSTSIILGAPLISLTVNEWFSADGGMLMAPSARTIRTTGGRTFLFDQEIITFGDLFVDAEFTGDVLSVKVVGDFSGDWQANSIRSMTVGGDMFDSALTLNQAPGRMLALGKLRVGEYIADTSILSAGNIGNVDALAIQNSTIFAGVNNTDDADLDGVLDLPDPATDLRLTQMDGRAFIRSVRTRGDRLADFSFINSNIAAADMGNVQLVSPQLDNNGVEFGLAADSVRRLTIFDGDRFRARNLQTPADDIVDGDARVLLV